MIGSWQTLQRSWQAPHSATGPVGYGGTYGASLAKSQKRCAKFTEKFAQGKRCGFPPSKKACERKMLKHCGRVETSQVEQLALEELVSATDPQAAADQVNAAAAANIAAIQAETSTTPYIVGGIVLLAALAGGAVLAFGGK